MYDRIKKDIVVLNSNIELLNCYIMEESNDILADQISLHHDIQKNLDMIGNNICTYINSTDVQIIKNNIEGLNNMTKCFIAPGNTKSNNQAYKCGTLTKKLERELQNKNIDNHVMKYVSECSNYFYYYEKYLCYTLDIEIKSLNIINGE